MAVETIKRRPVIASLGPLNWLRKNLFSSWWNGLLTIVTAWLLYVVMGNALVWTFTEAKWSVVVVNLRLLMIGAFPEPAVWRIWVSLALICLLAGLSWAVWGKFRIKVAAIVMTVAVMLALGPVDFDTRLWFVACGGLVPLGFLIGHKVPAVRRWPPLLWFLALPLIVILLHGFRGSTLVPYLGTSLWNGLLLTVLLAVLGIALSFPLGVLLALGRQSTLPVVRYFSIFCIEIVRGVPLVSILFMGLYIIPIFLPPTWRLDTVLRALIALTMFSSAYLAENVRGGLQSIPNGQREAALAMGMKGWQVVLLIVLPQALRAVIPTLVGQFIGLFKDTSLVVIVSLIDLMGIAKSTLAQPAFLGRHIEVYVFIAAIYFVISATLSYGSRRTEKALGVGER